MADSTGFREKYLQGLFDKGRDIMSQYRYALGDRDEYATDPVTTAIRESFGRVMSYEVVRHLDAAKIDTILDGRGYDDFMESIDYMGAGIASPMAVADARQERADKAAGAGCEEIIMYVPGEMAFADDAGLDMYIQQVIKNSKRQRSLMDSAQEAMLDGTASVEDITAAAVRFADAEHNYAMTDSRLAGLVYAGMIDEKDFETYMSRAIRDTEDLELRPGDLDIVNRERDDCILLHQHYAANARNLDPDAEQYSMQAVLGMMGLENAGRELGREAMSAAWDGYSFDKDLDPAGSVGFLAPLAGAVERHGYDIDAKDISFSIYGGSVPDGAQAGEGEVVQEEMETDAQGREEPAAGDGQEPSGEKSDVFYMDDPDYDPWSDPDYEYDPDHFDPDQTLVVHEGKLAWSYNAMALASVVKKCREHDNAVLPLFDGYDQDALHVLSDMDYHNRSVLLSLEQQDIDDMLESKRAGEDVWSRLSRREGDLWDRLSRYDAGLTRDVNDLREPDITYDQSGSYGGYSGGFSGGSGGSYDTGYAGGVSGAMPGPAPGTSSRPRGSTSRVTGGPITAVGAGHSAGYAAAAAADLGEIHEKAAQEASSDRQAPQAGSGGTETQAAADQGRSGPSRAWSDKYYVMHHMRSDGIQTFTGKSHPFYLVPVLVSDKFREDHMPGLVGKQQVMLYVQSEKQFRQHPSEASYPDLTLGPQPDGDRHYVNIAVYKDRPLKLRYNMGNGKFGSIDGVMPEVLDDDAGKVRAYRCFAAMNREKRLSDAELAKYEALYMKGMSEDEYNASLKQDQSAGLAQPDR